MSIRSTEMLSAQVRQNLLLTILSATVWVSLRRAWCVIVALLVGYCFKLVLSRSNRIPQIAAPSPSKRPAPHFAILYGGWFAIQSQTGP